MKTLLKNVTLIDGTGSLPIKNAAIAIREGKIQYAGHVDGWMSSNEEWIDLDLDIILANDPMVPDWIMQKNIDTQGDAELSMKLAYEAGVPIAMGSDAGTPLNYHGENSLEIYWMQQAGLSAMDAIVAGTRNAARAIGWDTWLGTLEQDKVADLIVLDVNPLDDLRMIADKKHLRFVMKDGKVVACHTGHDLPSQLFATKYLSIE